MRWLVVVVLSVVVAVPAEARVVRGSVGERTYRLFVPDTPAPPGVRRPVVFVLHGGGNRESGDTIAAQSGFDAEAQARGWIAVYPDARGGRFVVDGYLRRVGTITPRDELRFARRLLARLADRHRIDRSRVFATGFSNGGFLAYALACDRRPLVAAIAPVGTTETIPRCANAGTRPVGVLHLHARDDAVLRLDRPRRYSSGTWPTPGAAVRRWQARNRSRAPAALRVWERGGHGWLPGMTQAIGVFFADAVAAGQRVRPSSTAAWSATVSAAGSTPRPSTSARRHARY